MQHLLGLGVLALRFVERAKVVQVIGEFRTVGAEQFLLGRERALVEILRLRVPAFQLVDGGEIDLRLGDRRIGRAQGLLPDRERLGGGFLGIGELALRRINPQQLVERDHIVRMIGAEPCLDAGFELSRLDQRSVIVACRGELIGLVEDGVEILLGRYGRAQGRQNQQEREMPREGRQRLECHVAILLGRNLLSDSTGRDRAHQADVNFTPSSVGRDNSR